MGVITPKALISITALMTASGVVVATVPTLVLAVLVADVLVALGYWKPAWGMSLWLAGTAAIPYWLAVSVGAVIPPATVLALPLILGLLLRGPRMRVGGVDGLVLLLCGFSILAVGYGSEPSRAKDVILVWGSAYLLGRLVAAEVGRETFARVFLAVVAVVAVWSLVEFALDWHPFTGLFGPVSEINFWNTIQTRGVFRRSEAAFGHAITLGGFLVLGIPWALQMKHPQRWWTLLALGIAATISRSGVIGIGAATLLSVWALGASARRLVVVAVAAVLGIRFGGSLLFGVGDAAAQQMGWSTNYRLYLLKVGFQRIHLLSGAGGQFQTIDNAPLRVGLDLGWVASILFSTLALIPLLRVILRKTREPAEIALAATVPILLTVALLTQWQSILWFIGGVSVTWALQAPDRRNSCEQSEANEPSRRRGGRGERVLAAAQQVQSGRDQLPVH